jgi:cobyrinic acid a,c-diamide synthase
MRKTKALIVAGTGSGVGKTTVTLGIMGAFQRSGFSVQPFKAGPDYIDPGYHGALRGRPSYNLDTWMMGVSGVRSTFSKVSAGADVAVVEGVMGLFDGRGEGDEGSTAHLAKVLKAPVLLVVNGAKMARSAGAIISGFEGFDPGVKIRWVVFNNVGSAAHYDLLKRSLKKGSKVEVLGFLPRDAALATPERHLGLVTQSDIKGGRWREFLKRLNDAVESGIDMAPLLRSLSLPPTMKTAKKAPPPRRAVAGPPKGGGGRVRIAVAKDRAFSFYYQENLDILSELGAELVPVSPMRRKGLPANVSGLYLGGGYPELYGGDLEANSSFRRDVRAAARAGLPIYAECGGLMYLGRSIRDLSGAGFKMAGVFPWTVRMTGKRKALGYREVVAVKGWGGLKGGLRIRGHEFHYSEMMQRPPSSIKRAFSFATGPNGTGDGYLYKNTMASYTHLHFGSNIEFAKGFVDMCRAFDSKQ